MRADRLPCPPGPRGPLPPASPNPPAPALHRPASRSARDEADTPRPARPAFTAPGESPKAHGRRGTPEVDASLADLHGDGSGALAEGQARVPHVAGVAPRQAPRPRIRLYAPLLATGCPAGSPGPSPARPPTGHTGRLRAAFDARGEGGQRLRRGRRRPCLTPQICRVTKPRRSGSVDPFPAWAPGPVHGAVETPSHRGEGAAHRRAPLPTGRTTSPLYASLWGASLPAAYLPFRSRFDALRGAQRASGQGSLRGEGWCGHGENAGKDAPGQDAKVKHRKAGPDTSPRHLRAIRPECLPCALVGSSTRTDAQPRPYTAKSPAPLRRQRRMVAVTGRCLCDPAACLRAGSGSRLRPDPGSIDGCNARLDEHQSIIRRS